MRDPLSALTTAAIVAGVVAIILGVGALLIRKLVMIVLSFVCVAAVIALALTAASTH